MLEPMNLLEPSKSVMRRLVRTLMLVAALFCGVVFGLYKMRVDIPALNTPKIYAHLDSSCGEGTSSASMSRIFTSTRGGGPP